jgi:hypothetical protein
MQICFSFGYGFYTSMQELYHFLSLMSDFWIFKLCSSSDASAPYFVFLFMNSFSNIAHLGMIFTSYVNLDLLSF